MKDEQLDVRVRHRIYRHFVQEARAPSATHLADHFQVTMAAIEESLRRLHGGHAIVLQGGTTDILMAHPFSAVPTGYETHIDGVVYWPNCGWDSMGIAAAIDKPARVTFRCPDCNESTEFSIRNGQLDDDLLRVHFAVPARSWWDDIVFT